VLVQFREPIGRGDQRCRAWLLVVRRRAITQQQKTTWRKRGSAGRVRPRSYRSRMAVSPTPVVCFSTAHRFIAYDGDVTWSGATARARDIPPPSRVATLRDVLAGPVWLTSVGTEMRLLVGAWHGIGPWRPAICGRTGGSCDDPTTMECIVNLAALLVTGCARWSETTGSCRAR
jgi:hypothetical protein